MEQTLTLKAKGFNAEEIAQLLAATSQTSSKTVEPKEATSMKGGRSVDVGSVQKIDAYAEILGVKFRQPFVVFTPKSNKYTGLTDRAAFGQTKVFAKIAGFTGAMDAEAAQALVGSMKEELEKMLSAHDLCEDVLEFAEKATADLLNVKTK